MARKSSAKKAEALEQAPVIVSESPEKGDSPPVEIVHTHTHRTAAIAEIAKRNRETRDAHMREEGIEPEDTGLDEDEEREADGDEAGTATEAEAEAETTGETTPEPKTRKFIVNGQEVDLNEDQITAYVQKGATADQRLRDATLILEGAKRLHSTDATRTAGVTSPPLSGSSPDVGKPPSDADVGKLSKAILYGSEEEVRGALSTLVSAIGSTNTARVADMANQSQMKPEQVRSFVSEAIAFENAKSYLDRPPEQGGFSDIWTDPVLKSRFIQRESEIANELHQAGQSSTYLDIYTRTAKEIRDWREGLVQRHTTKTGLENRGDLKRSAGVVRGASGKPQTPVETQPPSHEQKLDKMRKGRGQL